MVGRSVIESLTDEDLVLAYQRDPASEPGRRAASALLMRWRERLYFWCWRMVRDRELALDLTQECLVRAYRGLPDFESRSAVSSWLFAIARNRCRTAMRTRPLRRDPDVDLEELDDMMTGPDETAEHRMRLGRVLEAMDRSLEPMEQRALWLRAHEGLTVDEITRVLGVPGASGARSILQSARRKLRASLVGSGEGVR
jgi:RNA polymerase sigma-70 factor (ECF subfamily)